MLLQHRNSYQASAYLVAPFSSRIDLDRVVQRPSVGEDALFGLPVVSIRGGRAFVFAPLGVQVRPDVLKTARPVQAGTLPGARPRAEEHEPPRGRILDRLRGRRQRVSVQRRQIVVFSALLPVSVSPSVIPPRGRFMRSEAESGLLSGLLSVDRRPRPVHRLRR